MVPRAKVKLARAGGQSTVLEYTSTSMITQQQHHP